MLKLDQPKAIEFSAAVRAGRELVGIGVSRCARSRRCGRHRSPDRQRRPRTGAVEQGSAADQDVVQPTKFELVINLKTAKALGVKGRKPYSPPPTR